MTSTIKSVNDKENDSFQYLSTKLKEFNLYNLQNIFQYNQTLEKSKTKTVVFNQEKHYFVINNPSAQITFSLIYYSQNKSHVVYQWSKPFMDIFSERYRKDVCSAILKPAG